MWTLYILSFRWFSPDASSNSSDSRTWMRHRCRAGSRPSGNTISSTAQHASSAQRAPCGLSSSHTHSHEQSTDFPRNKTYGCSSVVNSLSLGERRVDLSYFVYSHSRLFIFTDKTQKRKEKNNGVSEIYRESEHECRTHSIRSCISVWTVESQTI